MSIDRIAITLFMRGRLLDVAKIPATDIAWMNRQFDPTGKNIYVDESMMEILAARDSSVTAVERWQYVYRVWAKAADLAGEDYTEQAERMVASIAAAFPINARSFVLADANAQIDIINVEPGTPGEMNGWWMNRVAVTIQAVGDLPAPFDLPPIEPDTSGTSTTGTGTFGG